MAEVTTLPLVTVAIPTRNRPALLQRALNCVHRQDYRNIELLIADNCSEGNEVARVIESFRAKMPDIKYVRHTTDIGGIKNFFSLLDRANGKYFMWLADDDEISPNYVSALTQLLESNPDAASAAGHWVLMLSEDVSKCMQTTSLPQRSSIVRAARFIWNADDAFFYGLHRTTLLRKATFGGYWWPNRNEVSNWAYVFLLDIVLSGRILLSHDRSVRFINHNYTAKTYSIHRSGLKALFMYVTRRINVHLLYLAKIGRALGPVAVAPMVFVSLLSVLRESSLLAASVVCRQWQRLGQRNR